MALVLIIIVQYRSEGLECRLAGITCNIELFVCVKVQYFFRCCIAGETQTLALMARYGPPDETLLSESSGVVWACRAPRSPNRKLEVVDVKFIVAWVAMIPCDTLPCPPRGHWDGQVYFVMDKLGVDVDGILGNVVAESVDSDDE